jgi:hypothetical protein
MRLIITEISSCWLIRLVTIVTLLVEKLWKINNNNSNSSSNTNSKKG